MSFLTAVGPVRQIDADYWREWLTTPVDFMGALERVAAHLGAAGCYIIETGAQDALTPTTVATLAFRCVYVAGTAASMRRGQPDGFWEAQRSRLEAQISAAVGRAPQSLHAITTRQEIGEAIDGEVIPGMEVAALERTLANG